MGGLNDVIYLFVHVWNQFLEPSWTSRKALRPHTNLYHLWSKILKLFWAPEKHADPIEMFIEAAVKALKMSTKSEFRSEINKKPSNFGSDNYILQLFARPEI